MDFRQQYRVIFHVFEHFYGHDPVVVFNSRQFFCGVGLVIPFADVTGNDAEVLDVQSPRFGGVGNVFSLRMGVGNGSDFAIGVLLQEMKRETPPSASQVDDVHPILDGGALAVQIEHCHLRRLQLLRQTHFMEGNVVGPKARRILLIRPEAQIVKAGGNLVMLLVGQIRVDGDGHAFQFLHDAHFLAHVALDAFVFELEQCVATSDADGVAEEEVGEEEPREFGVDEGEAEVGEAGGQGGEVAGEVGL
mmetsp:Transcript_13194/g.27927  ORF Transcript_13194/g.27927 Transcript_13194/m.27927 type:complete len:248 (+) Transcript_13194:379-1122(+)